jgi:16S rRNA (guanine966-N2)-methyltransferase
VNVRLISGKYGGRIIEGSGTDRTHPMSERIRNAIFNKLGAELDFDGLKVLDAFAGSGSLGFEALSRGANDVVFVERDHIAQKIITNNIKTLGVAGNTKLVKAPVASWASTTEDRFDLIFADPPYHDPQLSTAMKILGLLKPNGLMVLSLPSRSEVPTELGVVVVDNRSYGNAAIAYYRREDA